MQSFGFYGIITDWKDVEQEMEFLTHSVEETEALGEKLGQVLLGGEILAYRGIWGQARPPLPGVWPGVWGSATG